MTRLLILVEAPLRLSREEAGTWLRAGFAELTALAEVQSLEVSALQGVSPRWPTGANWLIEAEVSSRAAARELVDGPEGRALLADFRRLGMHPAVQVVEG